MLRYTIDRAKPGLVAFYGIWPGNGQVYSYNPRTCMGLATLKSQSRANQSHWKWDHSIDWL